MQLNQVERSSMLKQKWLPTFSNRPGNNRIGGYLMLFKMCLLFLRQVGSKFKHGYTEKFLLSTWLNLGSPGERKPRQRNCLDPVGPVDLSVMLFLFADCCRRALATVNGVIPRQGEWGGGGVLSCVRKQAGQARLEKARKQLPSTVLSSVPVFTSLDVKLLTCTVR